MGAELTSVPFLLIRNFYMITRVKAEFKKDSPDILVITDESKYDAPIKYLKIFITVPGYTDARSITIVPNKVNTFNASIFNLYTFPDGLYTFVVDAPDCTLEFEELNTSSLDKCIDDKIKELAECEPDFEQVKIVNDALIQRSAAKQLDCNALKYYQLSRKLVCKDCN